MRTKSYSSQQSSIQFINCDVQGDTTPLFLLTEPETIVTVKEASPPFLSLVGFIKEGNRLDEKETKHACALLERIKPQNQNGFTSEHLLFKLVPSPDGSCSGFTESIFPLITLSNENLVHLHFSEYDTMSFQLLRNVIEGVSAWQEGCPTVQKRSRQIQAKLCEEGFSDETELHMRSRYKSNTRFRFILLGAHLIHTFGGNASFSAER
ncbi:hypothetical protein BLNAU_23135 [Blattamonas nauphoetae]|uniref:Uncharacterized protein n=1 Tax=Blattamonas nauphoetae TaxID=2049346 RepID=A0ABQ9WRK3_9EUKA|nr:hypothetical protein BLNAU_23135 [Blattamonas nauphoetae]